MAGSGTAQSFMSAGKLPRTFFDTNILVYADDFRDPIKQHKAENLIADYGDAGAAVVSLQVMQEYFVTAIQRLKLDVDVARRKVELFSKLNVAVASTSDILAAIDLHRIHRINFWDALVLRMAKESGCRVLFTEDMQHQQQLDGIQIINPFE
jgi:predicted nucleic acid-binding protein